MQKNARITIRLVILMFVFAIVCAAAIAREERDTRLDQKLTYSSGYKRLHEVADDLTKQTGVTIYCGKRDADWRVRDIPLVVCVKDLPLGKALRTIAGATHVILTSHKIQDQDKITWTYRLARGETGEVETDADRDAKHQARLTDALWQWDAMVAYGKSQPVPGAHREQWLVSRVVASLGPTAKDRLLNGETFRIRDNDSGVGPFIDELYNIQSAKMAEERSKARSYGIATPPAPDDEDVADAELTIKLIDSPDSSSASLTVYFGLVSGLWSSPFEFFGLPQEKVEDLNLPPRPLSPLQQVDFSWQRRLEDAKKINMAMFSQASDWDRPLLQAKFDLDKPRSVKEATFADLIQALASASGVSIVVEDFASHLDPEYQDVDALFTKGTSVARVLRGLHFRIGRGEGVNYNWYFNENDGVIMGWDMEGTRRYTYMLPQAYLANLKSKINGSGLEIDDLVHLKALPPDYFYQWIWHSRDFLCLQTQTRLDWPWSIYDSLKPADKSRAQSKDGLPFARLDASSLAGFFRACRLAQDIRFTRSDTTEEERQKIAEEDERRDRAMSDPEVIASMVMHVQKTPALSHHVHVSIGSGRSTDESKAVPTTLKLYNYSMTIDYRLDDNDYRMDIPGPDLEFPVYSSEREAQILKENADKEAKADLKPELKPSTAKESQ